MITPREKIYQALFDIVVNSINAGPVPLMKSSRRWKPLSEVARSDRPTLFQSQVKEKAISDGRGIPYKWELFVMLDLYVSVGDDPTATPSSQINAIMDAIEAALPQKGPFVQDLGLKGVSEAKIFGDVLLDAGDLVPDGTAIVPVRIVAT